MAGNTIQIDTYVPIRPAVVQPPAHPSLTALVSNMQMIPVSVPQAVGLPVTIAQAVGLPVTTGMSQAVGLPMTVPQAVSLPITVPQAVGLPITVPQAVGLPITASHPVPQQVPQVVPQQVVQQVTLQVPQQIPQPVTPRLAQPDMQAKKVRKKYKPRKQYICTDCGREFPQSSNLKAHMRTHTGEKPFKCDLCGNAYRSSFGLKQHTAQRHEGRVLGKRSTVKRFVCKECPIRFNSSNKLTVHMRVHTGERPFFCKHCGKGFMQVYNMRRHERTHTGEKPYACSMCEKNFCDKSQLIQHTKNHLGTKVTCTYCEQKFTRVHGLNKHMQKMHPLEIGKPANTQQMIEAREKYLGAMAASDASIVKPEVHKDQELIQYVSTYIMNNEGVSPLVKLNKEPKSHELAYNTQPVTASEQPMHQHVCPHCPKSFSTQWSLKRHILIHTGEKPHVCTECGHGFRQSCSLVAHMVTHTSVKPHTCLTCGKGFTKSYGLKEHMRLHTGEKPHICPHCSRAFRTTANLAEHIRVHTGVKRLKCTICNKTFNKLCNIKRHIRTHTGEKPYVCSYCNRAFNDQGALKAHLRRHTGERPFRCILCPMAFAQRFARKVHIKRHHATALDPVEKVVDPVEAVEEEEAPYYIEIHHQPQIINTDIESTEEHASGNLLQNSDTLLQDSSEQLQDFVAGSVDEVPVNPYPHVAAADGTSFTHMAVVGDHRYPHVAAEVELTTEEAVGVVIEKPSTVPQHDIHTTDYLISVVGNTATCKEEEVEEEEDVQTI